MNRKTFVWASAGALALVGAYAFAQGSSTSPLLNDLAQALSPNEQNQAGDIATATTSDLFLCLDVSDTPDAINWCDTGNVLEVIGTTSSAAELTYLDITTLGTGAASKALVLDSNGDYTFPATATIVMPSGGDFTLQSGSTLDVAGTFEIANTAMTSSAAELNYNDITTLGTGAASKSVVLDASGDYTFPSTATIVMPSSGTINFQSGSTVTLAGTNTLSSAISGAGNSTDVTLAVPTNGGDAGAVNNFVGVPKIAMVSTGVSVNGTTNTIATFIDETPAGEWTANDGDTVVATDATNYKVGAASLELAWAASAAADDGADNTAPNNQDWSADESVGVWIKCTATLAAGDLVLEITDGTQGASDVTFPALTSANVWTWIEIDASGVADASKDDIDAVAIDLSSQGATALGATTCEFDFMVKWDGADEEALGQDVYQDGVFISRILTAAAGVNDVTVPVAYTDYFIHYEAGNDFLVAITDLSTYALFGFAALE